MLRRMAPWIFASLLACFPLSLQALPFFVAGDSDRPGGIVDVGLGEQNIVKFDTATIEVLFDKDVLSFQGASLGELISDPGLGFVPLVINVGIGSVLVSLVGGLEEITGSGELLRISFEIEATALPGPSLVSFRCPSLATCESDYDIPEIPETTGTVTVLSPSTPIPLPSSAWLLALGLAAAFVVRIRS
ncbi:MAG: hypothetical protein GEV05_08780 [Betaproteobacteria bacterium]|nr:hypothetical protein [Betaproteobacteria bacterium]